MADKWSSLKDVSDGATKWETLKVDDQDMQTFAVQPEQPGPHPGLVVIMHRGGVDPFVQAMTRGFAAEGYYSIAPDLFHREGAETLGDGEGRASRLRDTNLIQDVNACISHLQRHPSVQGQPIGIVGFCMGGRISYLMATSSPDLKAAVLFYSANTMTPWGEGPAPFELTSNISCPVLGHFGLEDQNPSPEDVRKIDAEMTRLGKVHEFHSYEGAGHGFLNFGRPYPEAAAKEAWDRTTVWLANQLKSAVRA